MTKFVLKKTNNKKSVFLLPNKKKPTLVENKTLKNNNVMLSTQEKIAAASEILQAVPTKRIKKDKGLIERAESITTILTEDNKELLTD